MPRIAGATNILPFESRNTVTTTATQDIRHLARQVDSPPLEQFKDLLRHQGNYLNWIDTRHNELLAAKKQLNPNGRGPKDAIFRKYRWYAEQQTLLEAINAFEVFYKRSFTNLSVAIQTYVPADRIKGTVDAKIIWTTSQGSPSSSLIFEHQLFHNLANVDEVTNMLVGAKRYMPNNLTNPLRERVKALQAVFQIRHTLSHNQGNVTQSDRTKFAVLGYHANQSEVLDPSRDHFGVVVRDLLVKEANEFTAWLLEETASFLSQRSRDDGVLLQLQHRDSIVGLVGTRPALMSLPWQ